MGYLHIDNLYKNQAILLFKECYALEKVHGTSGHVSWRPQGQEIKHFAGGSSHEVMKALFDNDFLKAKFAELFLLDEVVVYGECYGGKTLGMSNTYGKTGRFVAFDVKVGNVWLSVPQAADVCAKLNIAFVDYTKVPTTLDALNAERDKDSTEAIRAGMGAGKLREGVVLRPLIEVTLNNGGRVIAKHKRDEFMETKTPREVSPEVATALTEAQAIADEWVTPQRLLHVLDKLPADISMEATPQVIKAMVEDVHREGEGEFVPGREADKAIGAKAARLFKQHLQAALQQ